MTKPSILIVDDDKTTVSVMKLYLEGFGYKVCDVAASGRVAIEKAKKLNPDLVLMDIKLGEGLDGIDAAEIINRHYGITIVFVTAHADDLNLQRAKEINPAGFINKPLRDTDLKTTIEIALTANQKEKKKRTKSKSNNVEDVLRSLYSLSPAEARVASKLIEYPDIKSIAEQLNLSIQTIKTHLKHIYRKTETNRQSVLIHKLVNGPLGLIIQNNND